MLRVSRTQKWIRGLLMASVAALGVAALAAPARAGDIIALDPTGGGGAVMSNILQVSSFAYLPGNTLGINGGSVKKGDLVHLVYQAILGSINTSGGRSAALDSNSGDVILIGGGSPPSDTMKQIVIEAEFTEVVTSVSPDGLTVTFAPSFGADPNSVKLYAQSAVDPNSANINDGLGNGFTGDTPADRVLILTGSVSATGFTSSFTASTDPPIALDQHAGGNTPASLGSIPTIQGSGNTSLQVAVSSYSSSYFLTPGMTILALNFNTISAGVPFRAVEPETVMFTGNTNSAANLGPINGTGEDFLFQSQANNDFQVAAVPEPGTLTVALMGIGLSTLAGIRRARRTGSQIA